MDTVLIVEKHKEIRALLRKTLESDGTIIFEALKGQRMLEIIEQHHVDAVLLDIDLPDGNGIDFIPKIRERTDIPILIVNELCHTKDTVSCLNSGADDFIKMPCEAPELVARLQAHLRRYSKIREQKEEDRKNLSLLKFDNWILDRTNSIVLDQNKKIVPFTHKEFLLLDCLIGQANQVLKREQLCNALKKNNYSPRGRAIDIKIARIRRKLDDCNRDNPIIRTIHGVGYIFTRDIVSLEEH